MMYYFELCIFGRSYNNHSSLFTIASKHVNDGLGLLQAVKLDL